MPTKSETSELETLLAEVEALKSRVATLESMAHTDHTLGADAVGQIGDHVMGRVVEHLRKSGGHSGMPSVG